MSFKKVRLGEGLIFKAEVLDENGKKIDNWVCMKQDIPKVFYNLNKKYGLGIFMRFKSDNRDLDWAL